MVYDRATVHLSDAPAPRDARRVPGADADWLRIGLSVTGPLLTLAVAIAIDLLARRDIPVPNPTPILLLTVAYAGLRGGLQPAIVSALVTLVYGVHYFAEAGRPFHYTTEGALSLAALVIAAPAMALLAGRRAGRRAEAAPAPPELAARLAFHQEITSRLALATDVEETLQSVARAAVPALGDWCMIQLRQPGREPRTAGFAHREPEHDALVRELSDRGWPMVDEGDGPITIYDDASGLAPGAVLALPLAAGGRRIGRVILGRAGGEGFGSWEVADAADLAHRLALALDHGCLLRAWRDAETRYRDLFEANPQPMWIFDVETLAFLEVNDAAVRQYGYSREELMRMTVIDLSPPDAADLSSAERVGPSRPGVALTRHQRRDGSVVDVEIASHPLQIGPTSARLVMATDVTERVRTTAALSDTTERLRHAHRMDVVGRLADGIAHDFNNLLTAMQGYSDLVLRELDPNDPRRSDVEEIRRGAERGAVLSRQLLSFAGRPALSPRPVDLNAMVADLEMLVQRLVGADVRVASVLAPHLGRVWADPGQLEQVLVSLVLAAHDAMPHGGELVIETAERRIAEGGRSRVLRPGRYVVLSVSDTGRGFPTHTSQETGLGFSVVYGIVRQLGGVVRVLTDPDRGTTVKAYLPRMEEEAAADEEALPASLIGTETVLVVEDEEGVRHVLRRLLTRYGYRVLEARHGRDALLEAERCDGTIDLLLTDVVMPEMGGPDLAHQLRARWPGLKVLFMSGYTNEEILRRGLLGPDAVLVAKPFASDELIQEVRRLLDAAPAAAGAAPAEAR